MTTNKPRHPESFASIVTRMADVLSVAKIAAELEVSQPTVYSWMDPDRLALPNIRQAATLERLYCAETGENPISDMIAHKATPAHPIPVGGLHQEVMDLPAAVGNVVDAVRRAIDPNGPGGDKVILSELIDINDACQKLASETAHVVESAKQGCVTLVCEGKV